ncbi:MAG: polymer-forming cytoskeletal protein [Thermoanaerobaculia bacterium]
MLKPFVRRPLGAVMISLALLPGAQSALAAASPPAAAAEAPPLPGLRLEAGSIARQPIVAVGRGVEIEGEALSGVTALNGSVSVTGLVHGDVTVLGGDLTLSSTAAIDGDALVLGGRLVAAGGSRLSGRAVAYPTVSRAWLTLLEGPSLGLGATSPLVLGAKLGLVAAWLALTLLLFASAGRPLVRTSEEVQLEPLRCFATGLVGLSTIVLTALFLSAFLPTLLGIPLLALVALFSLALKLWGMVAIFHSFGRFLASRIAHRRVVQLHAAVLGLALLGLVKLVPMAGMWVWTAATLVGMGATLRSKFGRFEPWFDGEASALV